jgi:hypothetical protein
VIIRAFFVLIFTLISLPAFAAKKVPITGSFYAQVGPSSMTEIPQPVTEGYAYLQDDAWRGGGAILLALGAQIQRGKHGFVLELLANTSIYPDPTTFGTIMPSYNRRLINRHSTHWTRQVDLRLGASVAGELSAPIVKTELRALVAARRLRILAVHVSCSAIGIMGRTRSYQRAGSNAFVSGCVVGAGIGWH